MTDHFLEAYRLSIMTVIQSQFTVRQLPHGREGAELLATSMHLDSALMAVNMDLDSLKNEEVECLTEEEVQRRKDKENKSLRKRRSFSVNCGQGGCGCGTGTMRGTRQGRSAAEVDPHAEEVRVAGEAAPVVVVSEAGAAPAAAGSAPAPPRPA